MTKSNYITDVGKAIEKLADALDPQRSKPFRGDILDLLEWAKKDVLEMRSELAAAKAGADTAWAQARRLAFELECLLLNTRDTAVVSRWWDSGMEALNEYQELQPGAKEEADAWASMRRSNI